MFIYKSLRSCFLHCGGFRFSVQELDISWYFRNIMKHILKHHVDRLHGKIHILSPVMTFFWWSAYYNNLPTLRMAETPAVRNLVPPKKPKNMSSKSEDLSRYLQIPDEELNAVEEETGAHFLLLTKDEHPGRLTWNRIMKVWKIMFLSKWMICRFHVNLPGWSSSFRSFLCFFSYTSGKQKWLAGFFTMWVDIFLPCFLLADFPMSY